MQILFSMNEQKISKYFHNFIPILRSELEPALFWPTKEENAANLPKCFKHIFRNCRAVCGCTEVEL